MLIYRSDSKMIKETMRILLRYMEDRNTSVSGTIGYEFDNFRGRSVIPEHMERFIDSAVDELVALKYVVWNCGRLYVTGTEPKDIT